MFPRRFSALCGLMLVSGLAAAEVRVDGPVEYGLFETRHQNFQPGERVLTQSNQTIQPTDEIPARLGSKFGMRYRLEGKVAEDTPLTLLYLTPGVRTPDGKRHDKFEVVQKLVPGAAQDVMAYEFTENHEVVPGQWHFMVFQGDRLLAEQRFTVR
ncbi:DUF3859 domain-containing protein [Pseudomonas wadenswilerensis]|jgi:hypothetical protein|uniref:Helicase n=1 Tax=Pseudomonas wadenswilerensis TaxID=1785161 RepID=A0A380T327_9PSED|nr:MULTISPECIES: DUF3859 domain-containing protein [Pseudomonas]MCE5984227.1 DUF3859 domain-containing protein [Pseudomonas sp. LF19]UVM23603.1 DUF3859 domain-containing protein [Pseudomonas wadenswilerensis]SPO67655.1 conserved exported protein of unknown function [Pseudomonas sp. JV241A]SUQ64345.1 Helicase [Pseudomonas wadenswilerensis]